jgi:hypothetical protein
LLEHKPYTSKSSSTYLDDLLKKNEEKVTSTADGTVVEKTDAAATATTATDTTAQTTGQVSEMGASAIIDEAV